MSPVRDWAAGNLVTTVQTLAEMMSLAQNVVPLLGYYGFILFDHFIS